MAGAEMIPQAAAKSLPQVSHMGAGSQGPRPSSTALTGHKQGAGQEAGLQEL